jgi:FixJ family two-component response regulator
MTEAPGIGNAMSGDATAPLIAIVDDDESFRKRVESLVRSAGYRSVIFESGATFLESQRKETIRCLILDIHMPEMDGLEVQRRLAAMQYSIPTIVLTGGDAELRELARKEGAFAVLPKTLGGEALLSIIALALQSGLAKRLE